MTAAKRKAAKTKPQRMEAPARPTAIPSVTPARAMTDDKLLGTAFQGESWHRWRAVLKAAYAEEMTAEEIALFREVAERDPPAKQVRELWVIVGRRGGKDSIASVVAACAALGDYSKFLRPGERATVMCLACDRDQARIVMRYIAAYFQDNPLLRPMIAGEVRDDGLDLTNNVEIIVSTNNFRAVRGRAIACVIFDEVAYWRSEDSASPDVETYNAVMPGLITLPNAMLVGISTPYRRAGLLFTKWRDHYGKPDDDALAVRGRSTLFNPTLPPRTIDQAVERDPEAAAAEWLAEWRSDLSDFLDRELVEAAVECGVTARPPASYQYSAFCDPSGGRGDSFTAAIAHSEGNVALLDALHEKRSPFEPTSAVQEIATLLRAYGIAEITGDKYAANWVIEAFAKEGIAYRQSERDRSNIYLDALPLFTAGRVRLLDNVRMIHQFVSLERRTSRIGKDRIDHPPGAADDLCNSAAGVLVEVSAANAPALIHAEDFLVSERPAELPVWCDCIFAAAALNDKSGMLATTWWARSRHGAIPLLLLEFEVAPLSQVFLLSIQKRIDDYKLKIRNRGMSAIFTDNRMVEHAAAAGVRALPLDEIVENPGALAMAAAMHVNGGRVKIAQAAYERSAQHPLRAALQARFAGGDDPLAQSVLYGIVAALHEAA
jgi:hypothetical protein